MLSNMQCTRRPRRQVQAMFALTAAPLLGALTRALGDTTDPQQVALAIAGFQVRWF